MLHAGVPVYNGLTDEYHPTLHVHELVFVNGWHHTDLTIADQI